MQQLIQQFTVFFQQLNTRVPWMPASMLSFFLIVAAFLALTLLGLILRLLFTILSLTNRRRRRDRNWQRQLRLQELRSQHRPLRDF